jgi:hypothetical protein
MGVAGLECCVIGTRLRYDRRGGRRREELLALVTVALGALTASLAVAPALMMLVALALVNGLMTSAAVLLEDRTSRAYPLRDLVRLIALGPLDLFVYRPFIVWARLQGTWRFLRGDRGWHKFERNDRPASA